MVKVNFKNYSQDFIEEFTSIKKLIIFNNPSTPITVIVNGSTFIIENSKTFECGNECFDIIFECKNVTSVTLEFWK